MSDCPSFPTRFFWRERGDDFLKARIASERVPKGIEAEVAVRRARRDLGECFKLFNSQVARQPAHTSPPLPDNVVVARKKLGDKRSTNQPGPDV
jgi:hypothetical protein